uniref:DEAD/DEAH box helicase n=1 Tax=viral metagenome TaxID=1070528 RepID=A0A6C0EKT6_9ZZZZ
MDEKLYFHKYTENELSLLLTDLAKNENLNVNTLLKNFEIEEALKKKTSKLGKKVSGKALIIIEQNKKVSEQKLIGSDIEKLDYYKDVSLIDNDIIGDIGLFKTDYGKHRIKYKLLESAYKTENMESTIELYLQIISVDPVGKIEKRIRRKVEKRMIDFNYKEFQFESLSNRLPPLDFYNNYEKKLEDWQIKILKQINHGKDVLIIAKTSMGKTWLAMYPGLIGKRTLFIVPTKPLAYQVASTFNKFLGGKTSLIVNDITTLSNNETVVVGTPKEIEDELSNIDCNFDIIVCDEIHNLNNYDGDCYERLIKLFTPKCQFIALSATIGNPEEIKGWFEGISSRKLELEMHSARFINLQRQVWTNNTLEKIHPFSCLTLDDITESFLSSNIPFTPYDNIQVFKELKEIFGDDVSHLDISTVFPEHNKRLSLNDSKFYEDMLKRELIKLRNTFPDKMVLLLNKFNRDVIIEDEVNLYNLVRTIKANELSPCIIFQNNTYYCKEIFNKIVYYLESLEKLNYPYHYDNLEFQQKLYMEYMSNLDKFSSNIKLGATVENKAEKKDQLINDFKKGELEKYYKRLMVRFDKQKIEISNNKALSVKIKKIQLKKLEGEYEKIIDNNAIKKCDIFQKHVDFTLVKTQPMSAEMIRQIRKKISNQLNIKVDYNNSFIQGLKRGIGIYTNEMPEIYNQIVQSLAQNGDLEFIVSDKTLALGINMPFRSSCIMGYKDDQTFTKNDYEQMIGRSGRRGQDNEGHIIYCNVDWKQLMKGKIGNIMGQTRVLNNYNVLSDISKYTVEDTQNIYKNYLNTTIELTSNSIKYTFPSENLDKNIIWRLRYYEDSVNEWLRLHDILNMEYKKDSYTSLDLTNFIGLLLEIFIDGKRNVLIKDRFLSGRSQNVLEQYKTNMVKDRTGDLVLIELAKITRDLYNCYISSKYYINLMNLLKQLFGSLLELINKNQCLSN